MQWWREARFGLFIHWGVYAVPAGNLRGQQVPHDGAWLMDIRGVPVPEYEAFARDFNPVKYDAEAWVRLAKEAGMKYIVITTPGNELLTVKPVAEGWAPMNLESIELKPVK